MRITQALLLASLAASPLAVSAELDLPSSVELMALNGQKQDDKAILAELPAGKHQLVIRYADVLRNGSKDKLFTSKPLVLALDVAAESDSLELTHKILRNYRAAEAAFDTENVGWQLTRNGQESGFEMEQLIANGVFPYADIEKAVRYHNKEKGIILTSAGAKNITDAVVTVDKETGKAEISGDPVTQLKLWYTKASKEEQKAFRRWLIDQE